MTDPLLDPLAFAAGRQRQALAAMPACNVVVLGKTGVGKSTLLNGVFGADLATTGVGRPVTQHIEEHHVEGVPVTIIDTRGIELDDNPATLAAEFDAEIDRRLALPIAQRLHVLWYCVSAESARFETATEGEIVRRLGARVPTVLVLTRAYDRADPEVVALQGHIAALGLPVRAIVPVLALGRRIGPLEIPVSGLDTLVAVTQELLPEAFRLAFVNGQIVEIDTKLAAALARAEEIAEAVDTRYRPLAFLRGTVIRPAAGADVMLARVLTVVGETAAVFGPLAVREETIRNLATAAVGERGGPAAIETLVRLLNRILVVLPPIGPGVGVRLGGKLLTALVSASIANHQDLQARKRAALLTLIIGRAAARTFADAARAELDGAPLDAAAVKDRFDGYVEDEARRIAEP